MSLSVRQSIYSLPFKRPKKGGKVNAALKHHARLLSLLEKNKNDAWAKGALPLSDAKLRKYGASHLIAENALPTKEVKKSTSAPTQTPAQ